MHLLGAFSDVNVAHHVENAMRDVTGESLGHCQIFKRARIHGEVFHSKSYARVFRRNSHTVTYEDNQYKYKMWTNNELPKTYTHMSEWLCRFVQVPQGAILCGDSKPAAATRFPVC